MGLSLPFRRQCVVFFPFWRWLTACQMTIISAPIEMRGAFDKDPCYLCEYVGIHTKVAYNNSSTILSTLLYSNHPGVTLGHFWCWIIQHWICFRLLWLFPVRGLPQFQLCSDSSLLLVHCLCWWVAVFRYMSLGMWVSVQMKLFGLRLPCVNSVFRICESRARCMVLVATVSGLEGLCILQGWLFEEADGE